MGHQIIGITISTNNLLFHRIMLPESPLDIYANLTHLLAYYRK